MRIEVMYLLISLFSVFNVCSMSGPAKDNSVEITVRRCMTSLVAEVEAQHTPLSDLLEEVDKLPTVLSQLIDKKLGVASFRCPPIQWGESNYERSRIVPGGASFVLLIHKDGLAQVKIQDVISGNIVWSYAMEDDDSSDVIVDAQRKHLVVVSRHFKNLYHITTANGCKRNITKNFSDKWGSELRLSWLANQNMVTVWECDTKRAFLYDIARQKVIKQEVLSKPRDLALQNDYSFDVKYKRESWGRFFLDSIMLTVGKQSRIWRVADGTLTEYTQIKDSYDGRLIGEHALEGKRNVFCLDLDGVHMLDMFDLGNREGRAWLFVNSGTITCDGNVLKMYRLQDLLLAYREYQQHKLDEGRNVKRRRLS